jgi:hypothetical protein
MECGRFDLLRRNQIAGGAFTEPPTIAPVWDPAAGAPYICGVALNFAGHSQPGEAIPLVYFKEAVLHAVSGLVAEGQVAEGEIYRWRVCAHAKNRRARETFAADDGFVLEETSVTDAATPAISLEALLAHARHCGPPSEDSAEVPVLFASQVVNQASELAAAAGALEAGGILLGRLGRDTTSGDLALEITAQVAAQEAIASEASLRFTPDAWRAVDAAIRLRGGAESIVGWWHCHPQALWPCRECPPERRAACASNRTFFSKMDVGFHRTAFQRAHNVALLLSFHADLTPRLDLFGWRRGVVSERGFYIREASV